MKAKPQLRIGLRIPPRTPGHLMSGDTQDLATQLINAICNMQVVGGKVTLTPENLVIEFEEERTPSESGGESGSPIQRFRITAVSNDFVSARTWDGTNLGADTITIAKQANARRSETSLSFSGKTWTITYASHNSRTLTSGSATFNETLIPGYNVNDIIFATKVANGTGVTGAADYIEVSTCRVWKMNLQEWDVCDESGDLQKAMMPSTDAYES
jgi:hypothetical protein